MERAGRYDPLRHGPTRTRTGPLTGSGPHTAPVETSGQAELAAGGVQEEEGRPTSSSTGGAPAAELHPPV